MNKLTGKVAVITGGNSGIGYATAQAYKEAGASVIITGRSQDNIDNAAHTLGVQGIVADVTDLTALDVLVEQVAKQHKKIDVLFVNAGIFAPALVGQVSESMFDNQMAVNFKGAVFTIEKFLPVLSDGASIINLSSINAYTGMPTTAIYAASKAALNAYTRTAATELAPRNIRVNAINPGPVETPIFSKTGLSVEQLTELSSAIQSKIPLKRFGQPSDIAKLATFLASDDASFITGSEYNIDGGLNINAILS